jgi:hypothetical protein
MVGMRKSAAEFISPLRGESLVKTIKDILEIFLFALLTLFLYLLFVLTIPMFRDSHGLIALNELSNVSRAGIVKGLIFLSAVVCVLSGVILMEWTKSLTPGVMAHVWSLTYFYVWADSVLVFSIHDPSLRFFKSFAVGLAFIYLFFLVLTYLGFPEAREGEEKNLKKLEIVHYWVWLWFGFYFGLSCLLVYHSFFYYTDRLILAAGSMILCLVYYLLGLHLRKAEGKDVKWYLFFGRLVFIIGFLGLAAAWIVKGWVF